VAFPTPTKEDVMSVTVDREYRTRDKTGWGDGPWNDEPDKLQWVDEATGLDCLIVRGPVGALCGYVGVPAEHPWHGIDYGGLDADVHGGLTYSDRCQEGDDESKGICHVPPPGRPVDVWWFGFDCAHSGDVAPTMDMHMRESGRMPIHEPYAAYRTVGYVQRECARLAEQLAAIPS
jgi:hypothetical protein